MQQLQPSSYHDARGKLVFIVNPAAGNGRAKHVWKLIEIRLLQTEIDYLMYETTRPLEAVELAAELAVCQPLGLVAVGGDGTLHEIASGLASIGSVCPLSYIPAGSGNDFARSRQIPLEPDAALDALLSTVSSSGDGDGLRYSPIDMLCSERGWAVNSMGAGLDGYIIKLTTASTQKRWLNRLGLGSLVYPLTLLRALLTYRPQRVTVTIDGEELRFDRVWLIAVTNIDRFGGGMRITPDAAPDDGYADICIVSGISRFRFLLAFPKVYKGAHTQLKAVHLYRCRQVRIDADKPLTMQADGEYVGETPTAIELRSTMLNIISDK